MTSVPLLTIFGARNDPLHFRPRWRERFSKVEHVVVPGGYHFPMCDDPDLVVGAVERWAGADR